MIKKENFIKNPNIPESELSLALIDGRARESVVSGLKKLNINIIKTQR